MVKTGPASTGAIDHLIDNMHGMQFLGAESGNIGQISRRQKILPLHGGEINNLVHLPVLLDDLTLQDRLEQPLPLRRRS